MNDTKVESKDTNITATENDQTNLMQEVKIPHENTSKIISKDKHIINSKHKKKSHVNENVDKNKQLKKHFFPTKFLNVEVDPVLKEDPEKLKVFIFQTWRKAKLEEIKTKKLKEKELLKATQRINEEKEKEKQEKKLAAEAVFKFWSEKKQEETMKKKQNIAKEKKEKSEDTKLRKETADKVFKIWKERKEEYLKEIVQIKNRELAIVEDEKEDEKWKKHQDSMATYIAWKAQKEKILKEENTKKKNELYVKTMMDAALKREKDLKALRAYEEWINTKENSENKEQIKRKCATNQPSWLPPGLAT